MKKLISMALLAIMLVSAFAVGVFAENQTENVYVTISDGNGIVVANEALNLSELESADVENALKAVHKKHNKTFTAEETSYGLSITSLWSVENGGSYGYYINDISAWSLADPLKAGDRLYAFVYSDAAGYSDTYSYFDKTAVNGKSGDEITLTLMHHIFTEDWSTVSVPVAGASVTLDGKVIDVKTDENGKATFKLTKSGVLSAVSDELTLVPPICVVTIESSIVLPIIIAVIACALVVVCVIVLIVKRKRK